MQPRTRKADALPLAVLLALCSLSIFATAAQGANEWNIGGVPLSEQESKEASVLGSAAKAFKIEIPWYATTIECKSLSLPSGTLLIKGKGTATFRLTECSLFGPPFVAETCKVTEPIDIKVSITLIEHKSGLYALFAPQEKGKPLGTVAFKKETECPLPLSNNLNGSFVGTTTSTEAVEQPIEFDSTTSALFSTDTLTFGTHPASLVGKTALDLGGSYKGEKWAPVIKAGSGQEWRLLRDESGFKVSSLDLTVETIGAIELLVPELEIAVYCELGLGVIHVGTLNESKDLVTEGTIIFEGCNVKKAFEETCKVRGREDKVGSGIITAQGTGEGVMEGEIEGEEVFIEGDGPLVEIVFDGEECPLAETEGKVTGRVEIFSALKLLHLKTIGASGLNIEGLGAPLPAELHGEGPAFGSIEEVGGRPFAIHLCGKVKC